MQNFPYEHLAITEIKNIIPARPHYPGEIEHYPGFSTSILTYRYSGRTKYSEPDGNAFDFCAGEILYIPSRYPYNVKKIESGRICVINFVQQAEITNRICKFRISNPEKLCEMFGRIEECWTKQGIGYRNECMSILYDIFRIMEQNSDLYVSNVRRDELFSAKEYIDAHYSDLTADLSNDTLAKLCGISEGHFNKLFRDFFHRSPRQYICEKRLADAESMMLAGNRNISEIASICGFGSVHYFSRYFRKKKGISPSEYLLNFV